MLKLEFSGPDVTALLDALRKGASRHESYAKFYGGRRSAEHHTIMAHRMNDLRTYVQKEAQKFARRFG